MNNKERRAMWAKNWHGGLTKDQMINLLRDEKTAAREAGDRNYKYIKNQPVFVPFEARPYRTQVGLTGDEVKVRRGSGINYTNRQDESRDEEERKDKRNRQLREEAFGLHRQWSDRDKEELNRQLRENGLAWMIPDREDRNL